jgi:type VI secretion system protein ImpA
VLIDDERRAAVLAPINDSVGTDGRGDEGDAADLLREIRSQRKAIVRIEQTAAMTDDDVVLPPGAWDWETLAENALEYLAEHGKDLEPMSVVIEAAARSEGLGDLAAAMTLLAELVEAFWEQGLYPAEDEDGLETRFQPLSGLSGGSNDRDGSLIQPLRNLVIARTGEGDLRYLDKVRADLAMAASQGLSGEAKTARLDEASTLTRTIEGHARRLSGDVLSRQAKLAGEAEDAWRRAIGFIIERTKPQMPAASKLGDELRALRQWLLTMAPTQAAEEAPAEQAESGGAGDAPAGGAAAAQPGGFVAGKITRREDALKAIAAAADYFQQHEPLSPLAETLREVDRRARMSLHDFLTELIPDDSARQDFYWRSGIKPPSGDKES